MRIGIAGAGLAGRLCAYQLSQLGHQITVFDAGSGPSPALGETRAAAWTAAGMLSPIAEMESGGEAVRELGDESLQLWQTINNSLKAMLRSASSSGSAEHHECLECDDNPLGLVLEDSLMVCHAADMGAAQRVLRLLSQQGHRVAELNALEARSLAASLKGTLHAWRLHGEGHLHPQQAMNSLYQAVSNLPVQWRWQTPVTSLSPGVIELSNTQEHFDWVMDTRGLGAKDALPVRGVRGETIVLHAPGFDLSRAVRLLHPRWRVYIVPRPNHEVIVGATEIESEDRSAISVQSTMELLSAAFSIFPSLAEARILRTDVNLRPATPDNLPFTEIQSGLIRINGLFRHGWLLAPAVIHRALVKAELMKPQMEQRIEQCTEPFTEQRRPIEPRVSA